jgi:S1-C subfamily serine protease
MAIDITCPGCQSVYPVADNLVGKTIRCKKCGEMMPVTAPVRAAAPVAAKAARPAARIDDDEDDARPARSAARRARDEDDEARDAPKKKSALPLILVGGVVMLILLAGGGAAAVFGLGLLGGTDTAASGRAQPPESPFTNEPPPPVVNDNKPIFTQPTGTQPTKNNTSDLVPKQLQPVKQPTPEFTGPKTSISPERMMSGLMDTNAIRKVAAATVLIYGEGKNGSRWTGTGWFGLEPGLLFTNAHVLSMLAPSAPPPAKLTVHLYKPDASGGARVTHFKSIPHQKITILGVDRQNDLAVLKISNEPDLPTPLAVRPSSELQARQGLTVFGFPLSDTFIRFGGLKQDQQPEMSIRPTTVTTIREDGLGRLQKVQLEGGITSGNSGGPIVDAEGNVVSVVVSGLVRGGADTQLVFGVPTEYVFGLLAGRMSEVELGQAYRKDGKVHIPVTVECLDPFNRLKATGVGFWVGDTSTKVRSPGATRTGAETSDTDYKEVALTYTHSKDKQVAKGEVVLPELPAGRSYWVQPYYSNALVAKYYMPGTAVKMSGPPIDLEAADLVYRPALNVRRPLTVTSTSDLIEYEEDEGVEKDQRRLEETELKGTETVLAPTEQGSVATIRVNYASLVPRVQDGGRMIEARLPPDIRTLFNQGIRQMIGFGNVNRSGEIYKINSDVRATGQLAPLFKILCDESMETLQATAIPLPGTRVNPNHTWKAERNTRLYRLILEPQLFGKGGAGGPQVIVPKVKEYRYRQEFTYTYLGARLRAGVKEAVVKVDGKIVVPPGSPAGSFATGSIKGYVYVDLNTGTILEADIEKDYELDSSSDGLKKRISGINKYKLSRGTAITATGT